MFFGGMDHIICGKFSKCLETVHLKGRKPKCHFKYCCLRNRRIMLRDTDNVKRYHVCDTKIVNNTKIVNLH